MLLLRSAVARRTVDGAAFVAPQFWKHINGLIWWDLHYLHNDMRVRGALSPTLKRRHWLQWFSQKIQMETPGDDNSRMPWKDKGRTIDEGGCCLCGSTRV